MYVCKLYLLVSSEKRWRLFSAALRRLWSWNRVLGNLLSSLNPLIQLICKSCAYKHIMLATRFQRKLIYQTLNWKWVSTSYTGGEGVGFVAKVFDLSHLDQVFKGPTRGNHWNTKSKTPHFCKYCCCAGERGIYAGVVCMQKERFIQVSRVDEEERKRRKQQKLEREQVKTLQMSFCWRVCSRWFDRVSALNRRSWMMRWASPGSSTPFPSLYVQLAAPLPQSSCLFSSVFIWPLIFILTCRGNLLWATTCCWMWCTPSTSSTVLCQRCTFSRIIGNMLLPHGKQARIT